MWPVKPPNGAARPLITVRFRVPGSWLLGYHPGTDIGWTRRTRGRVRERVRATYKGRVVTVGYDPRYYGNYVVIYHHDARLWSWYCHLESVRPSIRLAHRLGRTIHTGAWLGYMGSTGNATGDHLHYEERTGANTYSGHDIVRPVLFDKPAPKTLRAQGWR